MLYLSLVAAGILLLSAHVAARRDPYPVRWGSFLLVGFAVAFFPVCVGLMFTAVLGQFVLLVVALAVWPVVRGRHRRFLPYSLAAVVIPFSFSLASAWGRYRDGVALRDQYPFVSMADRVPEPIRGAVPTREAAARLDQFDRDTASRNDLNGYQLKRIHEATVERFVNSPGFGISRGIPYPTDASLRGRAERRDQPPPQPIPPGSPWGTADEFGPVDDTDRGAFDDLHFEGVLDFVNREGWGYARGRREVAGFLPHAFCRVPVAKAWRVESVHLVGLLKHAEPVVYLTDRLPAMADAVTAPTRPVDAFEAAGLKEIRAGDDGYAGRRGDEVRFLGAVRSAAACVNCHGGERGDLLGAFAYRLRAAP